jgi:ribonuclease PH
MKRADDRSHDALRPVRVTRNYLKHAHGSCMFELGDTKVLCAASMSDGVAGWRKGKGLGWVTAEYALLPASTHTRSRRESTSGGPRGRTHEIQRLIGRSVRSVVDMAEMGGEYTLNIDCDVIQADGGTRTAAITGTYLAVYDAFATWEAAGKIAGVPLLDNLAATSVGMVDGEVLLDLDYAEDSAAEIDMNVVMDGKGRFIEVQGTGERTPFDRARLDQLLDLAVLGVARLVEIQSEIIAGGLDEFQG